MRIHLGHHFYGAGNLGDDFMLAGFLEAIRALASGVCFSACVPFDLEPLRRRFPAIDWQPYDRQTRADCIAKCDAWLGLGGSPFQSAQSRWFMDHLVGEAQLCASHRRSMFYLGIGVQTEAELAVPDVQNLCRQASAIWTRDSASANRLQSIGAEKVQAAADLAHVFFRQQRPPAAAKGRVTLVPNFDYAAWAGQPAMLSAITRLAASEHIWLAQENRDLPGAERALYANLTPPEQARWKLTVPDSANAPLSGVLAHWPSGEWLITARYHAALAGAWAGSKIVVIATNEKLRAAAIDCGCPAISSDASAAEIAHALASAAPSVQPEPLATLAFGACEEFVEILRHG